MKADRFTFVLVASVLANVAWLFSIVNTANVETMLAFGAVAALLAVAALDYRIKL
jgi:hypothetical protein